MQKLPILPMLLAPALALGADVSGQVSTPAKTTSSVSVGYVMVPFVLTDLKGKPIPNLREKDVTLLVDGQPVATDLFARSEDAPVSFTILLDGSGSMGLVGKMDGARAALAALLSQKLPGDDFSLYVFSGGAVREAVPFTTDAARLLAAVDAVRPHGRTAFYDALARMPDRSLLGRNGSRAIVLLTDGIDNASELSRDDLAVLLAGVDVPVYPIGLRSPGTPVAPQPGVTAEALVNLEILGHVARLSGGLISIVDDPGQLPAAIGRIERDLRTQYLLGFSPTGTGPVRYRRISLRLSGPARPVRVRAGYRGTPPPLKGG
ncbi:MAG: VWA domain-containing protein [Thermoanaerobaculia bacterium]|jgi:VWFA-related protein